MISSSKGFVHNFKTIEFLKHITKWVSFFVLFFLITDIATGFNNHTIHIVAMALLCVEFILLFVSYCFWRIYLRVKYKRYFTETTIYGRSNWYGKSNSSNAMTWNKAKIEATLKFKFQFLWIFGKFQMSTSFKTNEKATQSEVHRFYIIDFKEATITYEHRNNGNAETLTPHSGISVFKLKECELTYYNNPFNRISFGVYQETEPTDERWNDEFEGNTIPDAK